MKDYLIIQDKPYKYDIQNMLLIFKSRIIHLNKNQLGVKKFTRTQGPDGPLNPKNCGELYL